MLLRLYLINLQKNQVQRYWSKSETNKKETQTTKKIIK